MQWLSKLDPNVVLGIVAGLATFVYHLLSPSTQATINDAAASALKSALSIADHVMETLVQIAPPGTTRAQIEDELWAAAKVQLQHVGLDPDKLPPAAVDAAKSLVAKWLAEHEKRFASPTPIGGLP